MSSYPNTEVLDNIKQLVSKLTNFKEGSQLFNHVEKHVVNCVHNADSMVFLKKKDIDRSMTSLSEKFIFHGLPIQANDLLRHYDNFLPNTTPKEQCESRLNIMKFLLCIAESPTSKFLVNPEEIMVIQREEEEIDWPAYLREGIGRWTPPPEDSSDSWSDVTESEVSLTDSPKIKMILPKTISNDDQEEEIKIEGLQKDFPGDSIQDGWFLKDFVYKVPESTNIDANIAIRWDEFLEHSVQGLISIKRASIISEYCILREIIWQCFAEHNSFAFNFVGNDLLPKENVTISSVRPVALQTFLHKFLPYINLLCDFRSFQETLFDQNEYVPAPDTYRSYNNALGNFIMPVYQDLVDLERDILKQSSTHTLLTLENDFRSIFQKLFIVNEIHRNVIVDFRNNDAMISSTNLLVKLHHGLVYCVSKDELDIYLTLYLESLYKYFAIINLWTRNDTLVDLHNEFIVKQVNLVPNITTDVTDFYVSVFVENNNEDGSIDCEMGFVVRELSEICRDDSIFKFIYTEVLQIGKNIHFLRLLKKLHLLDNRLDAETLYEELVRCVLEEIASYFKYEDVTNDENKIISSDEEEPQYKFPVTCSDYCKYPTEMDRLENLVDTSDGFLMNAFRPFFTVETKTELRETETLYEKISKMTTTLYPAKQIIDTVLAKILQERYSQSGYLVKSILVVDFQMSKHFELLRHLFLFEDDIIFPLYRRLFTQMIDYKKFENDIWLTTHLHDIVIDLYPKLYEKCLVKVNNETQILNDPLQACELIDIKYLISWPVNLIIQEKQLEMYSELFRLILKVKWALYTLNHLYFNEIEPESPKSHQPKVQVLFLRKLKVFRFHLLNEFSNIQHYILGYVFNKYLRQFNVEFDKSRNLDTLILAHSNFINSVYNAAIDFRDLQEKGHGFNLLLYIVKKFEAMWKDTKHIDERELLKYQGMFVKCRDNLDPVIFPRALTMEN